MKRIHLTTVLSIVAFAFAAFLFSSCMHSVAGNGIVVAKKAEVNSFSKIKIGGAFEVSLKQGTDPSLTIEADENLHELIETKVEGSTLVVKLKEHVRKAEKLQLNITFSTLDEIDIAGAVSLWCENQIEVPSLEIECSGAAELDLDLVAESLELEMSGGSETTLTGKVATVEADVSGAGEIDAYKMETQSFSLDVSGAGDAKVNVTKSLKVNISGAGSVRYKGNPEIEKSIAGAGSVKPA